VTRIVINPAELRSVCSALATTQGEREHVRSTLLGAHLPELTPQIAGEVVSGLRRCAQHSEQTAELLERERRDLLRRAERMELDLARPSPGYCLPQPRLQAAKPKGTSWFDRVLDIAFRDDIRTLRDPKASVWSKALAAASLVPLPVGKGVKAGSLAVKGASKVRKAERAADATKGARRVPDLADEWRMAAGSNASRKLGRNLEAAGVRKPGPGYEAHHLVPSGHRGAQRSQELLQRLGVDPNEAANGVWLHSAKHRPIHTRAYFDAVARDLSRARTKQRALEILEDIRERVQSGNYP
jgi:A nuclease family of the HNH/ENDO VII superfamily with conserved AHH